MMLKFPSDVLLNDIKIYAVHIKYEWLDYGHITGRRQGVSAITDMIAERDGRNSGRWVETHWTVLGFLTGLIGVVSIVPLEIEHQRVSIDMLV